MAGRPCLVCFVGYRFVGTHGDFVSETCIQSVVVIKIIIYKIYIDIQRFGIMPYILSYSFIFAEYYYFDIPRRKRYPALAPQDWRVLSQVWRLYKKEKSVSAWSPLRCHLES